jgi:hypothetical protein
LLVRLSLRLLLRRGLAGLDLLQGFHGSLVVRFELNGQAQVFECLRAAAVLGQEHAEEPVRVGQVGFEPQGVAKSLDRPRTVSLNRQAAGQVVMAQGVIRLAADGYPVPGHGIRVFALKEGGVAEQEVRLHRVRRARGSYR